MSNSQVPRIVLNQDDTISIEVNVYGFDSRTPVEISGQVTQANGAIATFYNVQETPAHDDGQSVAIWVKSIPAVPPNKFEAGFPLTVVVRATEAWFTMLDAERDPGSDPLIQGPQGSPPKGAWASKNYGWAVAPPPNSAAAPASAPAAPASAPAAPVPDAQLRHGKWWDRVKGDPLTSMMTGRFTRLFPELPGARFDQADLKKLAVAMTAPPEDESAEKVGPDPEENPGIPAAYTYLGQFVDHDLTFDPISQLRERLTTKSQLQALVDFRTPRFDLDNLYGHGPDDQPYMYEEDGVHLLPGGHMPGNPFDPRAVQLPRGPNGRALIGDPRNDENRIVAQLHAVFLRFHNKVVDYLGGKHVSFAEAREQVRWHYQWVLVHDFLPTILPEQIYESVFPDSCPSPAVLRLRENDLELMPVEFSVAAYRFGHSMVRPRYQLNQAIELPIFSGIPGDRDDLGGFRPMAPNLAIDWRYFIDLDHGAGPVTPQLSYKIDTSIVSPLGKLPPEIAKDPSSLALRNLMRGSTFQLPSGQRVAEALGMTPLADEDLLVGKAIVGSPKTPMKEIARSFAGNAPLWAYVLSEAQVTSWENADPGPATNNTAVRLGPVGGRLVAEVFASLLRGDPTSYLYAHPAFKPVPDFMPNGTFGLAELINVALCRTS